MDIQSSISADELAGRLISVVVFNEATKHILNHPHGDEKIEQMNSKALYELGFLSLYAIMATCLAHPLLRNNQKDAHRFADLVQSAFLSVIVEKDKPEIRAARIEKINKDFIQRWGRYNAVVNQINSCKDNEKYVIEFEKIVNEFLGNNETVEKIKARLNKVNAGGWYLFLHLRADDTRKILDKYNSIIF